MRVAERQACRVLSPDHDPWLPQCFLLPDIFPALLDSRSTVVYALPGHGRSALAFMSRLTLADEWLHATHEPWQGESSMSALLAGVVEQIWRFAQARPQALAGLGARSTALRYFLDGLMGRDMATYQLECLLEDHPEHASPVRQLLALSPGDLFTPSASSSQKLSVLSDCVLKLGLRGVMVWIDAPPAPAAAREVRHLLDSLDLVRQRALHFKCLVVNAFQPILSEARGIVTGSVDQLWLRWRTHELVEIAGRRLRVALGAPGDLSLNLERLISPDEFTQFLEDYSSPDSPGEWVALAGHCLDAASTRNQWPLDPAGWVSARRAYCAERLKIRMDSQGVFWRGPRVIRGLTPRKRALYPLVKYLYEHPGWHPGKRLAEKLNMDMTMLNTYVYRARRDFLEPEFVFDAGRLNEDVENAQPIYLVKDARGEGYALLHTDRQADQGTLGL